MDLRTAYISVLLNGGPDPELYNCSTKTIEEWYGTGMSHAYIGSYFLVSGILFEVLYVICLYVMYHHEMMRNSCFKLMFFLGLIDIGSMSVNSLATGYFAITGAVYCTNPMALLTLGAIGCSLWCGSCATCVLLALNRCSDMAASRFSVFEWILALYKGKRVYGLISLVVLYILFIALFTTPASFNSLLMSWFFNPMTGNEYPFANLPHAINNVVVSITTTALYCLLCCIVFFQSKQFENFGSYQKQIFLQSAFICIVNAVAAYIYVYMQYMPIAPWVILVGQIAWELSTGSVPIIYLAFNKSIRNGVLRVLTNGRYRVDSTATVFPNTSRASRGSIKSTNSHHSVHNMIL